MKLADVLSLHPGENAEAASIAAAIDDAEAKRRALLATAKQAQAERAAGLLTLDEKAIAKLDRDGADAQLAADRIADLLPDMRTHLVAARGRES